MAALTTPAIWLAVDDESQSAVLGKGVLGRMILGARMTDADGQLAAPVIWLEGERVVPLAAPSIRLWDSLTALTGRVLAVDWVTLVRQAEVAGVYRYYLLLASTLAAPAAPAAWPPALPWSDTEPAYASDATMSLYTVECTVLSDGTWRYTPVSLSSSYEAAKDAWNKAHAAETRVTTVEATTANLKLAQDSIQGTVETLGTKTTTMSGTLAALGSEVENLTIGGRNLIRNSATLIYVGYGFRDNTISPGEVNRLAAPAIWLEEAAQLAAPVIGLVEETAPQLTAPVIELTEE